MPEEFAPPKLFSVEEANAMLPLVRAIAADMVRLSRDVIERRQRLTALAQRHSGGAFLQQYQEEVEQIEEGLQRDAEQLQGYVDELRELGVEPKSASEGLVDFPALVDGRLVYLCWKHGETSVAWWHELDGGFAGRQPLSAPITKGVQST